MIASNFIKIFFIVLLAVLSVSAQRECPSIKAEDNNTEKKRFIVIFDKEVKNAAEDHYEILKECYNTNVQNIIEADESESNVFDQSVIRDFSVDGSIQGYTSYFTPEFAKAVEKMKNVELVEEEREGEADRISQRFSRRFSRRYNRRYNRRAEDDYPPPNIDRIDDAKLPLNGKFVFPDSAGENVNIFVVDSGILTTHYEFSGRAKYGRTFCKGCVRKYFDEHGTIVASVAAGRTVGVARKANLTDIRVLNEEANGSTADMIEALSFVIKQHKKGKNNNSIVNMSIRVQPVSKALDHVVKEVTDAGIHMTVSAGNHQESACNQSPAAAPSAVTAGAIDETDKVAIFSNYGKCVDIFAPGNNMLGADNFYNDSYKVSTGTSFSSPLVAGTLALLISKNGNKPPAALTEDLIKLSTKGVIIGLKKGSPDALLRVPAP